MEHCFVVRKKLISCLFLECPGNFLGPESCFVFVVFAFKIKVSIILKIIQ